MPELKKVFLHSLRATSFSGSLEDTVNMPWLTLSNPRLA